MSRTYLRSVNVLVRVNTGPPTWRRPRASAALRPGPLLIVSAGWLRACLQVAVGTTRHHDDDDPGSGNVSTGTPQPTEGSSS